MFRVNFEVDMNFKIDSQMCEKISPHESSSPEIKQLKIQLKNLLADFPYSHINLEKDHDFFELIEPLQEELKIDLSQTLISKQSLLAALEEKKLINEPFLNPATDVLNLFDIASRLGESKKKAQFEALQSINSELDLLGKVLAAFQCSSLDETIDLNQRPDILSLIDHIKAKHGFPLSTKSNIWSNKQEVTAFLNQKIKELTHRSSEAMLHLQHQADQLKSMVDVTKIMIEEDSEFKKSTIRKSGV